MKKLISEKGIDKLFDIEQILKTTKKKVELPIAIICIIAGFFLLLSYGKNDIIFLKVIYATCGLMTIQISLYLFACCLLDEKTYGIKLIVIKFIFAITRLIYILWILLFGLWEKLSKRLNLTYIYQYGGDISLGVAIDSNILMIVLTVLQKESVVKFLLKVFPEQVYFVIWAIIFVVMLITVKVTIYVIARKNKDDSTFREKKFELTQEIRACTNILLLITMFLVYVTPMHGDTKAFADGFLNVATLWLLMNTIEDQTVNREAGTWKNE